MEEKYLTLKRLLYYAIHNEINNEAIKKTKKQRTELKATIKSLRMASSKRLCFLGRLVHWDSTSFSESGI